MTEIERLDRIAGDAGVVQDVLVRVTVGVEAHTHEFISTAHEDQKFGLSLASGAAMAAVRRVFETDNLRLVGLHSHIGSQIFDVAGFELAAHRVIGLLRDVVAEFGVDKTAQISIVDLGGGLGISYLPQDDPPPVEDLAAKLGAIVSNESAAVGLPAPTLVVEPGRAIAGPGTITLYEVGTVKDVAVASDRHRRYVSVDGGMSDNIRTSLYGAEYDVPDAVPSQLMPLRRFPGSSGSTARAATSSYVTRGCPTTSLRGTCWASQQPAHTAIRCRAVTT